MTTNSGHSNVSETANPKAEHAAVEQLPRTFIEKLEEGESEAELRAKYRILPKGFFLSEQCLDEFLIRYQEWHMKQTGALQPRSIDKIMRHLFESEHPVYQYIVEGKQCLAGYYVPFLVEAPFQSKIPRYQGSPLTAKGFLHPRDPIFERSENILAHLDNYKGLEITIRTKHGTYTLAQDFLKLFITLLEGNNRYRREFPRIVQGQRFALFALQKLLNRARPASKRRGFPFPARFRNDNSVKILRFRRLCIVAAHGDRLEYCFELRARNLTEFIRGELKLLGSDKHSKKIGPLFMFYNPGPSIFGFSIKGKRYKFSHRAFEQYLDMLLRVKFASRGLSGNYTLRDALRNLGGIIQRAEWIPKRDIPQKVFRTLEGHELLLSSGHWVFIIDNENCGRVMWDDRGLKRSDSFESR